jgi:hypothetical protein
VYRGEDPLTFARLSQTSKDTENSACKELREDYFECLHHRKEVCASRDALNVPANGHPPCSHPVFSVRSPERHDPGEGEDREEVAVDKPENCKVWPDIIYTRGRGYAYTCELPRGVKKACGGADMRSINRVCS